MNSRETQIFSKSKELFGLDSAIESIKQKKKVYVCEGYMDAIALKKAGIHNTVAVLGTSLTKNHIETLKKYTENIVLMFDKDRAGKEATIRSYIQTHQCNVNIFVTEIDGKSKDVDEFIRFNSIADLSYMLTKNQIHGEKAVVKYLMDKHEGNIFLALNEFKEKYLPILNFTKDKLRKELDLMLISLEFGVGEIISNENDRKFLSQFMKHDYSVPHDMIKLKEELEKENNLLNVVSKLNMNNQCNEKIVKSNEEKGKEVSENHNLEILKDVIFEKILSHNINENRNESSKIINDLSHNLSNLNECTVSTTEVIKYYYEKLSDLNYIELKNHISEMLNNKNDFLNERMEKYEKYLNEFENRVSNKYKSNEIFEFHYQGEHYYDLLNSCYDKCIAETSVELKNQYGFIPTESEIFQRVQIDYKNGLLFKSMELKIDHEVNEVIEFEKQKGIDKVVDMFEVHLNHLNYNGEDFKIKYNEIQSIYDYRALIYKEIEQKFDVDFKIDTFSKLEKYQDELINQVFNSKSEDISKILRNTSDIINERKCNFDKTNVNNNYINDLIKDEFLKLKKYTIDFQDMLHMKIEDQGLEFKSDLYVEVKNEIIDEAKVLYKRKFGNDADKNTSLLNLVSDKSYHLDEIIDKKISDVINGFKIHEVDKNELNISKLIDKGLKPSDSQEINKELEQSLISVGLMEQKEGKSIKI